MAGERPFDVVLLGATGFTGGLTAEYLAEHAPPGTRWALAGRNRDKLERVRASLAERNPACADLALLHADAGEPASMREIAEAARVVATTVGPYTEHGEPLVAACAQAGTGYVDITGEPEWVDRMYLAHHERAVQTGARLVHACGFDSIPYDLGVAFTVSLLPEGAPLKVEGFVRAGGRPSAGTFHSLLTILSRLRQSREVAARRREVEARPSGRRVSGIRGAPHHEPAVGAWVLPFPSLDPQIVLRSARALDRYGPDFRYGHYVVAGSLPATVGLAGGFTALAAIAQVPAARRLLMERMTAGEGPDPQQRAKGWFRVRFVGDGGGRHVVTEVSGGDPGYGETSKMLAESALCLAHDDLPQVAGQTTTAVAMGDALRRRLERAGIEFTVVEGGEG